VQTVCFEKLACGFDSSVKADSSLRRIQRFISEYSLDSDLVARCIFLRKADSDSCAKRTLIPAESGH